MENLKFQNTYFFTFVNHLHTTFFWNFWSDTFLFFSLILEWHFPFDHALNRWTHQSSCNIWSLLGKEAVSDQSHFLHCNAMPWRHMWCWGCEGIPAIQVWGVGWWSQCGEPWLHQGRWPWSWDYGYICACLHCFLSNWCQEKCQRLPCPCKYFSFISMSILLLFLVVRLLRFLLFI